MSSFKYHKVYIKDYETIVGPNEIKGLIKHKNSAKDFYYNETNIVDAEIKMQKVVLSTLLKRNKIDKVELLIGGDLSDQITTTTYNIRNKKIPFIGTYNACATFNESLIILSNFIEGNLIKNGITITSSHNLNAERQFRYPVEYGSPTKLCQTKTATGAACTLLTSEKTNIRIESSTIGEVVDYGITDASNMGAVMAPGASETLHKHLTELNRNIKYYDIIITGDLGILGSELFLKLIKDNYNYTPKKYIDAGTMLYDNQLLNIQGASGPTVVPLILFNKILKEKKYKKILVLATGALHSPLMTNLKKTIPTISHAISIEVINNDVC